MIKIQFPISFTTSLPIVVGLDCQSEYQYNVSKINILAVTEKDNNGTSANRSKEVFFTRLTPTSPTPVLNYGVLQWLAIGK